MIIKQMLCFDSKIAPQRSFRQADFYCDYEVNDLNTCRVPEYRQHISRSEAYPDDSKLIRDELKQLLVYGRYRLTASAYELYYQASEGFGLQASSSLTQMLQHVFNEHIPSFSAEISVFTLK